MINRFNTERFIFIIILSIILYIIYSPGLRGPFILDDTNNIEKNEKIYLSNISVQSLKKAAEGPRPVAMLTFAFNYYIHGMSQAGFRITNIFIHICTSFLLYIFIFQTIILCNLTNDQSNHRISLFCALIWSLHPIQIQSVTYIVQRMNSLAGMFFLFSLLMYIKSRLSSSSLNAFLSFLACILSAFLAIASKPNAMILPVVIGLYEYFFIKKKINMLYIAASVAIIAISVCFFPDNFKIKFSSIAYPSNIFLSWYREKNITTYQYFITELRVLVLYISMIFFPIPSRLNIDHDIIFSNSLISPYSTATSIVVIIFFIFTAAARIKKSPLLSFGIFWFFINSLIESSVVPLDPIFEHRNYVPSMMFISGVIFEAKRFFTKSYSKKVAAAVCIITLSIWTYQRNTVWRSGISLWQDSVKKSPNKTRPHESLAYYLEQAGLIEQSIDHYKIAVTLSPNNAKIHHNLANLLTKRGYTAEALKHYSAAFAIDPKDKELNNNIGNAMYRAGQIQYAIFHYEKAIEIDINYEKAHINLGNMFAITGNADMAIYHYDFVIKKNDRNIEALYNKSLLFTQLGFYNEAEKMIKDRIVKDRNVKEFYNILGIIQERLGKGSLALENYKKALDIDPYFIQAKNNFERLAGKNKK